MFIAFSKIEQAVYPTDGLQNPQTPGNDMVLIFYRTYMRAAFCNVYSKKAFGEYWNGTSNKKVSRKLWTPEMKAFYEDKITEVPKPPFVFKFTVIGWIFVLMIIGFFGYLTYDSMKPPLPKPEQYVAMEKAPAAGDVYFGHYEVYKEKGTPIGAKIGYGWFKVINVEADVYYLATSIEMHKGYQPKEQLNNVDFETEPMSPLKLSEQTGYNIRFKSADGLTEVYITDKK